jgi:FAD/FMN-containing dehydrogenase
VPNSVKNFGHNVTVAPAVFEVPADPNAVLACLEQHRGRNIRVIGSLHSWSEVAVGKDVVLDLRRLDSITLSPTADGQIQAEIGAGCTIDRVLDFLHRHGRYTLPTYGMVGKQTIAGAISTATHGSGKSSLSHYVDAVSVAAYDPATGKPRIFEWSEGDQLRAARCALGCSGVLLSIRVRVEKDYQIEERTQWFSRLDEVIAATHEYPRSQFYLMPWSWKWYAQLRRPIADESARRPGVIARLLRVFRLAIIDFSLNGAIRGLAGSGRTLRVIPSLFRRLMPLLAPSGLRLTDDSREILTMRHDLYRHVESELFVPAANLPDAATYLEWVLRCCGGDPHALPASISRGNFGCDVSVGIEELRRHYLHDYPITIRRVLQDDTLISMTSGDSADEWYAISLITYQRDLRPFLRMVRFVAVTMGRAYGARPHWGKICALNTAELAALYPGLRQFRDHCQAIDPAQIFINDFARQALGFPPLEGQELRTSGENSRDQGVESRVRP